jgi:spore coat protein A, manganese oxidase
LPAAKNVPAGFANAGRFYTTVGTSCTPGSGCAVGEYRNDQPTTALWYHDHTLGITRLNVYAAGAGFYLIRTPSDSESGLLGGVLPGPAPKLGEDPNGDPIVRAKIREIPLAIQPRSFNADGSLFYPADRAFFEGRGAGNVFGSNADLPGIPFLPNINSDMSPVWNPEAFFNFMVVNGKTWPYLEVESERYRFRIINADDARFLNLSLKYNDPTTGTLVEIPFYQIGSEQGMLPKVVCVQVRIPIRERA